MPEISLFYGIRVTMYYDDHNPPHFHVRYNEYRAIIDIQTGKVTDRCHVAPCTSSSSGSICTRTNSWKTGNAWRTAKRW